MTTVQIDAETLELLATWTFQSAPAARADLLGA